MADLFSSAKESRQKIDEKSTRKSGETGYCEPPSYGPKAIQTYISKYPLKHVTDSCPTATRMPLASGRFRKVPLYVLHIGRYPRCTLMYSRNNSTAVHVHARLHYSWTNLPTYRQASSQLVDSNTIYPCLCLIYSVYRHTSFGSRGCIN